MEKDMTAKFLCVLYYKTINNIEVEKNGMDVKKIWDIMGYKGFDVNIVPQVIDKLVYNNIRNGHIEHPFIGPKIKLTQKGKIYGSRVCPHVAGVI